MRFWLPFFYALEEKMKDEFMDIFGAEEFLKISKWTIYRLTRLDKIPCSRTSGTKLVFSKQELSEWVKNKQNKQRK